MAPLYSLVADTGWRFDYVLANPPFGKKSSMTFTNEEGEQQKDDLTYNRQDFWASTVVLTHSAPSDTLHSRPRQRAART